MLVLTMVPGVDGLVSLDAYCMAIYYHLLLVNVPFKIQYVNVYSRESFECLPRLLDPSSQQEIMGYHAIQLYLKQNHMDLDRQLPQDSLSEAYKLSVEHIMQDALLYCHCLEVNNFRKVIRPALRKNAPLVAKHHAVMAYLSYAQQRLAQIEYILENNEKMPSPYVHVKQLYKDLCVKLQDNHGTFLMSDLPCSLDLLVFAHLKLHAYPSLDEPKLFSMLTFNFPDLILYMDRMQTLMDKTAQRPELIPLPTYLKSIQSTFSTLSQSIKMLFTESNAKEASVDPQMQMMLRNDKMESIVFASAVSAAFIGYLLLNRK